MTEAENEKQINEAKAGWAETDGEVETPAFWKRVVEINNFLDELRLVRQRKEGADVVNDFATGFSQRADTLGPVLRALTVENYQLIDPSKRLIFVEGVTDYDHITAFMQRSMSTTSSSSPSTGSGRRARSGRGYTRSCGYGGTPSFWRTPARPAWRSRRARMAPASPSSTSAS
jgi:hypothetical protein